jgi:hypothetical protein
MQETVVLRLRLHLQLRHVLLLMLLLLLGAEVVMVLAVLIVVLLLLLQELLLRELMLLQDLLLLLLLLRNMLLQWRLHLRRGLLPHAQKLWRTEEVVQVQQILLCHRRRSRSRRRRRRRHRRRPRRNTEVQHVAWRQRVLLGQAVVLAM